MLDQRIGRHRRAVAEIGDVACLRGDKAERFANPCATACEGSAGVEGTFQTAIWPLLFSNRQISVNVPPESTPIRHAIGQYPLAAALPAM